MGTYLELKMLLELVVWMSALSWAEVGKGEQVLLGRAGWGWKSYLLV